MKKAVTLVEVIVGAIILAVTFTSLLTTFIGVRRYVKRANKRLITTDLASQTLNDLYRAVRDDTWDSGTLQPGSSNIGSYTIDGQVYQDPASVNSYNVTTIGDYRQVNVTVNYPE